MSEAPKAVFLSYASQDAEAAKRIADALRAAGVEVWFDQSELVGGDAWDAKIRKQIGSCALFVPIISAGTQARAEGYFRLEWKLADRRMDLIGKSKAFLLPVCIDDTKDADADVPDSFTAVQWTRLKGGETTPAFVARVQKLLEGSESRVGGVSHPDSSERSGYKTPPTKSHPRWLIPAAITAVLIVGALAQKYLQRSPTPATAAPISNLKSEISNAAPAAPLDPKVAEARALIAKAQPLHEDLDTNTRAEYELAEQMIKRAIELAPLDAEVWAHYAWFISNYVGVGLDRSTARIADIKHATDRAMTLDPKSDMAQFSWGNYYRREAATAGEAARVLEELVKRRPDFFLARRVLALVLSGQKRYDEALAHEDYIISHNPNDTRTWTTKAGTLIAMGRPEAEVDAAVDASLAVRQTPRVLIRKAMMLTDRADFAGAAALLDKVPSAFRQEDRMVAVGVQVALAQRQPAQVRAILDAFPRDFIEEGSSSNFNQPKALGLGYASWIEGKPERARLEWQEALRVVDERLTTRRTDFRLLGMKTMLLAMTGQEMEAEAAYRVFTQVTGEGSAGLRARIDAWSGRPEKALEYLEALPASVVGLALVRSDSVWVPLWKHPRFEALRAKAIDIAAPVKPAANSALAQDDKSIAVLPFANRSADKEANAFFADGMHEDILTNLARIRELRVVSRTSVEQYRQTTKSLPQIAKELGVAYILEGSVQRAGEKVRVTGQLIRAATDEHMWAESYDRDLSDVFAIQSELAKAIAGALKAALSPREQKLIAQQATTNPAAYDLYLKSRQIVYEGGGTRAQVQLRLTLLESAVELDPKYAEAWGDLAEAHVGMIASSIDTTPARLAKAKAALDRAVALAPDSPDVIRSTGVYYLFGLRDPARAVERFEELVQLQPNDAESRRQLSLGQQLQGRWAEALATARILRQLDPGNIAAGIVLAMTLNRVRRYDEAMTEWRRLAALRPDRDRFDYGIIRTAYYATGSKKEAEDLRARLTLRDGPDAPLPLELAKFSAMARGDYEEFSRLDALHPRLEGGGSLDSEVYGAIIAAQVYHAEGEFGKAAARLEKFPAYLRGRLALEPDNTQCLRALAKVEAVLGHKEEALRIIEHAAAVVSESNDSYMGSDISDVRVQVLIYNGDKDRAFAEIARLLGIPSGMNVHELQSRLPYRLLKGDPRFDALVKDPKNNAPLF